MIFFPFLIAFFVAYLCAPFLSKCALRWNVVDNPAVRKLQDKPIPLLGGVAVFLGVVIGSNLIFSGDRAASGLFFSSTLIFVVSLIDDKYQLSAKLRVFVQILAAAILIVYGVHVEFLPNNLAGNAVEIFITLVWILGITNAFNYLDGIDGLCSGLGIITSLFFFIILYSSGQNNLIFFPLALMGACFGFLPHNLKKENMFLGDSGSMFIGFFVAWIGLVGTWASDNIIKITVPILILGVPIFDMTFTTIMRFREKKIRTIVQWFEYAGRDHFHHYLMDLGFHQHGALLFILAISMSMGINAFTLMESDKAVYGVLAIFEGIIMFCLIGVLMVLGRRLHKQHLVSERIGY